MVDRNVCNTIYPLCIGKKYDLNKNIIYTDLEDTLLEKIKNEEEVVF